MIIKVNDHPSRSSAPLHKLDYSTACMLDAHPGVVYLKVNKRKLGAGIGIDNWPNNHSILFNPKLGTLRAIKSSTIVVVLDVGPVDSYITQDVSDYYRF